MLRFILRTCAVVCLAIAVMFAVIDVTKSVSVSSAVFTPFGDSWNQYTPGTLALFSTWLKDAVHPSLNDPVLAIVLTWPTFGVFAVLAFLLYVVSRKRRERRRVPRLQ